MSNLTLGRSRELLFVQGHLLLREGRSRHKMLQLRDWQRVLKPNEICVNGHEWNLFELNSFREKIASPSQARVTAALEQGLGLRLLRIDIDEVFHPLEIRTNKNPDEFESFEWDWGQNRSLRFVSCVFPVWSNKRCRRLTKLQVITKIK